MVVQHNLTAMNSNRMLGVTSKSQAKSTEKLSSGYKINRAADDAAGLSISEKMRKQIRGLTQASANAQDGISAVQTAEGALAEVHDMLQRMNELAVKAANGTNSSDDRTYIQNEVDQLVSEINRVSETTKFNETYLLKGDDTKTAKTVNLDAKSAGLIGKFDADATDGAQTTSVFTMKQLAAGEKITVAGTEYTYTDAASLTTIETAIKAALTDANNIGADAGTPANVTGDFANGFTVTKGRVSVAADLGLDLHVGADSASTNKISLSIASMSAKGIGIEGIKVDGENGYNATYAIDSIKNAIQIVSTQRSALGAVQNRLEHTINNLDNVVENTTSAESSIRDTDMASEMVRYSNNNILAQAGQSMLAQANQSNQGVLSLLR